MGKFDKLRETLGCDAQREAEGAVCVLETVPPVSARVLSVDHPDVERVQHRQTMETIGAGGFAQQSIEDSQDHQIELCAAMVTEWIGVDALLGVSVRAPADSPELLRLMPEWRRKIVACANNPRRYRKPTPAAVAALGESWPASSDVAVS